MACMGQAADDAHVVGWRGDGTGKYPAANPPVQMSSASDANTPDPLASSRLAPGLRTRCCQLALRVTVLPEAVT